MTRTSQGRRRAAGLIPALLALALVAVPPSRGETAVLTTTTSPATADTHVNAGKPTRAYGSSTRLRVRASEQIRTYLRFQVSGVEGAVHRALLKVRIADTGGPGFDVRGVASTTWDESITHRTAPAVSDTVTANSGSLSPRTWKTIDVTPLVRGDGPVSLALTRASSGGASDEIASAIVSRESGAAGPQLIVRSGPPPDTTPPGVAFTQPAADSTLSGSVALAADASDASGVDRVAFLVDGRKIGADHSAPYGIDWSTGEVEPGPHTLTAVAVDTKGNSGSATREVMVEHPPGADTDPPQTTIGSGPADTHRSGAVRFTFGSDEAGVTFECSLDGSAWAACASGGLFHVANGRHRLRVRARDAAGNGDATPAARGWWSDAIVQNGLFETGAAGWRQYGLAVPGVSIPGWNGRQANVTVAGGGIAGNRAHVVPTVTGDSYGLYELPRSVDATVAGRTYSATASVRSDVPGRRLCLEVIERGAGATAKTGSARRCLTATTAWQAFPEVSYTAGGGDNLYVSISQDSAAQAGDSFDVDGVELSDGGSVHVPAPADPGGAPRLLAFGDIATCDSSGDEAVARLVDTLPGTIAMVGDLEQNNGSAGEFAGCFEPTWDRHLWRTRPTVGDHEYRQRDADPYWDALGARAGERHKGWYSYDLGDWHIVVLNSNCTRVGGCGPGSEQYEWLRQDLADNATTCLGAYFHHPRFSSGSVHGGIEAVQPFWDILYRYSAEWVLGGNDANYQRFAPQTPWGERDDARGIRQFVVGTGGTLHYTTGPALPNTEVQHSGTFGALELTLGASGYDWRFVPQEGRSFTDAGTNPCAPVPPPDTTAPAVRLTEPGADATLSGVARMSAEATDGDRIDVVEFRAGGLVLGADRSAPYSADVDTTMLPPGRHTLTAVARDLSGNVGTSAPVGVTVAAPDPALQNLVANPGFESGLTGWGDWNARLRRVTGGAEGAYALRAVYDGSGPSFSAATTLVGTTTAGVTYRATTWVRSNTSRERVCLRLRELSGSTTLGAAETCLSLTSSWWAVPEVRYTTQGGGRLDVYAYHPGPEAGASFDLDGVRVVAG